VPLVVSTVVAIPLTVTVSVSAPTFSPMSRRTSSFTRTTMFVFLAAWNP
jgi:hypothetical protein